MPSRRRSGRSGLLGVVALFLLAPGAAEAAWEPYGEVHAGAGAAENALLLDPNAPAAARAEVVESSLGLLAGLRAAWDRSAFEISVAPYGEVYQEGGLARVSESLASKWSHSYTQRLSLRLSESFSEAPGQSLNPGILRQTNLPVGSSATSASDFGGALEFRTSGRTTLTWTISDARRDFSAAQFVDSAEQSLGFGLQRRLTPDHSLLYGYEYGVFSYRGGRSTGPAGSSDPNIVVDPNGINPTCDPAKDPNCTPGCQLFPLDPNCLLASWPAAAGSAPPPAAPSISRSGSVRNRSYVGYLFDRSRGFHIDLKAGYDLLVFDAPALGSLGRPFVQSAAGWRWSTVSVLAAYGQGVEDGGGVMANSMTRSGRVDVRFRIAERLSLDLEAGRMIRDELEAPVGGGENGRVRTSLATATLGFILSRSWSLTASCIQYVQRSRDLVVDVPEVRTGRIAVGAAWRFGKEGASPPGERL